MTGVLLVLNMEDFTNKLGVEIAANLGELLNSLEDLLEVGLGDGWKSVLLEKIFAENFLEL